MKHGVIPGQLHFRDPNPNLEWDRLPVRVVSNMVDWPRHPERPPERRSVHSEYRAQTHMSCSRGIRTRLRRKITRKTDRTGSCRSRAKPAQRQDLARCYLSWLDEHVGASPSDGDAAAALLADMAWTAGVGRSHFTYRKGIVFNDPVSLREGLEALAQTDAAALAPVEPSGAYRPAVSEAAAGDGNALAQAAAQAYEAGDTVAFAELFAGENRRRIPLPGYPFQRRRYWIE